ncbi:MAG TPA: hypothetical protein VFN35_18210 [Ktedonobacteraceae bacterium]|nr:hypothetical protein [Ktedonobacteraceae bacterium]
MSSRRSFAQLRDSLGCAGQLLLRLCGFLPRREQLALVLATSHTPLVSS